MLFHTALISHIYGFNRIAVVIKQLISVVDKWLQVAGAELVDKAGSSLDRRAGSLDRNSRD